MKCHSQLARNCSRTMNNSGHDAKWYSTALILVTGKLYGLSYSALACIKQVNQAQCSQTSQLHDVIQ